MNQHVSKRGRKKSYWCEWWWYGYEQLLHWWSDLVTVSAVWSGSSALHNSSDTMKQNTKLSANCIYTTITGQINNSGLLLTVYWSNKFLVPGSTVLKGSGLSSDYDFNFVPSVLWCCWFGDRKGIRLVKNWVVRCWRGYLSGARCRLAYGPADATATHCLLLQ